MHKLAIASLLVAGVALSGTVFAQAAATQTAPADQQSMSSSTTKATTTSHKTHKAKSHKSHKSSKPASSSSAG